MMKKLVVNDALQWAGVVFIILGHALNAAGNMDPYNIIAFGIGAVMFMVWSLRVCNKPQIVVNVISIGICIAGIYRAGI